jgi:hypothetical protein
MVSLELIHRRRGAASSRPVAAYSPDPALGAGFVSGFGLGVGRETPMLSNTNPKPFFSTSKKLMVPLPFRS